MINADLVGVEAQRTSPSITNPVTFVNDTTYAWSTPKWIVTREMMGITTIDQAKPAGVNSGGFIDKAGNLRILYTTMGNILGKASAISRDGGTTWSVDTGFVFPTGLKDGAGHFSVTSTPSGGFRAFARDDVGIVSLTSSDGQTWTTDPGYRVTVSSLGIAATDGAGVVQQQDGKYRMYLGDESPYFRTCGSTRPVSTVIRSATSTDQINWTVDADYRLGPEVTELCKLHPHVFRDSNGDVVMVFHINNYIEKGRSEWTSSCFFSRSKDGTTFSSIQRIPVGLPSDFGGETGAGDCDVVMMLRIQKERMAAAAIPSAAEYFAEWGLTPRRLALAKPDAIVMHPQPMVADGPQSAIRDQVRHGVAVRMAVLEAVAGESR